MGLRLVIFNSTTGRVKNIPDPASCRLGNHGLSVTITILSGNFKLTLHFCVLFSHDPATFATDIRVVGSVVGSAPVERPLKYDISGIMACDNCDSFSKILIMLGFHSG